MWVVDRYMPSIRPIWESALIGAPPLRDETITPARAQELHGANAARRTATVMLIAPNELRLTNIVIAESPNDVLTVGLECRRNYM